MHYLEDDLDLLEGVPERLKQQSLEMRELDARIQKINEELNINSREFFNIMSTLTAEEKERTFNKLREDYQTIRLMSQKKVDIAENMQLMLEKYQERIAKDLIEFKYELETDTPGVTETIEKDLCERIKNYNYEDSVRPSTSNMNFSAQRINGQRHFITDSEQYHQRGALNEPSSSSGRRRQAFVDDSSLDETYVPNTKKKAKNKKKSRVTTSSHQASVSSNYNTRSQISLLPRSIRAIRNLMSKKKSSRDKKVPNSANSDRDSQHQRKAFLKKLTGRRSTISSRDPSPIINSAISLNFIGDKGNQTTRFPFPNKNTPSTRDGGVEKGSTVYRASINTYSTTHHNTTNTTTSSTNFPLSKNSLQNYNAEGGSTTTTTSSIIIKPNQLSPSIALGTSSSYSQQQQQSSNSITPITTNSTMPTFVDGSESQYGRTVKLTSRVQQMLKDRQTHHRMGRPPGGAHFVASQPPQPIQQQPPSAFSKQQQSRNSITSNLNRPLKQEPEQIASRSYLDDDDFVMEEDEDERGGGGGGDQFSLPDDEEEDDHHHHIEEEEEEENNNNNDDDDDEDLRSMTLLEEEDENEEEIEEEEEELEDNRTWCICQKVSIREYGKKNEFKSEGDMVACDNKACPFEWFHYGCVGITAPPKGKWFCPECIKKRSRSQSQELLLNH